MRTRTRFSRMLVGGVTLGMALSLSACGDDGGSGSSDGKIHVLVYGDATNKVKLTVQKK